MSVEGAILRRNALLATGGKSLLNLAFPDEFELYIIALETLNERGDTLSYFIFPINPSMLDETQPEITNIRKTLGGVTSLSHPGFIPVDINLSGNFGRKFKVLLGEDYKTILSGFTTSASGATKNFFENKIKTGYGCIKLLESIIKDSKVPDIENGTKTLVFHNLALGTSYIVKPLNLKFSMSQESNMIWNYTLLMKGIAPLSALYSETDLTQQKNKLVITGFIQSQTNRLVNALASVVETSILR